MQQSSDISENCAGLLPLKLFMQGSVLAAGSRQGRGGQIPELSKSKLDDISARLQAVLPCLVPHLKLYAGSH
jgi:predicted metal-dependent hydrolase